VHLLFIYVHTFVLPQEEAVPFSFPYCHFEPSLTLPLFKDGSHEDLSQQVKFSSDPENMGSFL